MKLDPSLEEALHAAVERYQFHHPDVLLWDIVHAMVTVIIRLKEEMELQGRDW